MKERNPEEDRAEKIFLLDHGIEEGYSLLVRVLEEHGERPFRARQVWDWIFRKHVRDFAAMRNLAPGLRDWLAARVRLGGLEPHAETRSGDGTRKFLWRLRDRNEVESVRIPTEDRLTLCISSQVGCPLACTFCATGYMGLRRNLTQGEIAEQAIGMLEADTSPEGVNVVFMGMGEPLLNLDSVVGAVDILNAERGLSIGARRITISTAGIPPGIRSLARTDLQVRLAVSLHAADDALRSSLMPINRTYPLAVLLDACREYWRLRRRRISFEYVQLPGINDREEDVAALARLLGDLPAKVNLIPFNEITQAGYRRPSTAEVERFAGRLRASLRQAVSVRQRRGSDVSAACGQLWVERGRAGRS